MSNYLYSVVCEINFNTFKNRIRSHLKIMILAFVQGLE